MEEDGVMFNMAQGIVQDQLGLRSSKWLFSLWRILKIYQINSFSIIKQVFICVGEFWKVAKWIELVKQAVVSLLGLQHCYVGVCREMTVMVISEQMCECFTLLHIALYCLCLYGDVRIRFLRTLYCLCDICHSHSFFFFERERERERLVSYSISIDHIP